MARVGAQSSRATASSSKPSVAEPGRLDAARLHSGGLPHDAVHWAAPDGGATLLHGDSLEILEALPAESFDLVFADPPYFLSNGGSTCKNGKRAKVDKGKWDRSRGVEDNHAFNHRWLSACQRLLRPHGTIWVSGTSHVIYSVGFAMQQLGFKLLNEIDRQRHQMLRRALQFGDFKVTRNDAGGLAFALQIVNATDGHGAPTGFDAERLMFLHTTVTDRRGRVVYESGDRDPNGDVRDLHSAFVHHRAEKSGPWLEASAWKEAAGLARSKDDRVWLPDPDLFSLQSRFLTRNNRGG